MLKTENLTVRFGEKVALQDLSFRVSEGEWWCVAGPNGAGKTTLAGALGRSVPCEGQVLFRGREIRTFSSVEYAQKVGVLSQNHASVYGFAVEEVVRLGRYARRTGFLRRGDADENRKLRKPFPSRA